MTSYHPEWLPDLDLDVPMPPTTPPPPPPGPPNTLHREGDVSRLTSRRQAEFERLLRETREPVTDPVRILARERDLREAGRKIGFWQGAATAAIVASVLFLWPMLSALWDLVV